MQDTGHIANEIEALCAAPPEALASPNQTPLRCRILPPSQRVASCAKMTGGGDGGGFARRARAARTPKAKSCAASCGTSSATSCATLFTCLSYTCCPRASAWAACVCWAWVPPLEDSAQRDERLRVPVLRGAQHVLRHVLHHVLRLALCRVLHVLGSSRAAQWQTLRLQRQSARPR